LTKFPVVGGMMEEDSELYRKWLIYDGKTVDISDVKDGFNIGEFIESLSYSKESSPKADLDKVCDKIKNKA
jgi:hypothetical protein